MSNPEETQAAIERLRWWASDPGTWARDRDVLVVLAEVARLRKALGDESQRADENDRVIGMGHDMHLRWRERAERAENEVERLRAEREALHSDATRERAIVAAFNGVVPFGYDQHLRAAVNRAFVTLGLGEPTTDGAR